MFKAVKSFSGVVHMKKGDIKEIRDKAVAEDLLRVGYIEEIGGEEKAVVKRGRKKKEAEEDAD